MGANLTIRAIGAGGAGANVIKRLAALGLPGLELAAIDADLSALEDGSSFTVLDSEGNEWNAIYELLFHYESYAFCRGIRMRNDRFWNSRTFHYTLSICTTFSALICRCIYISYF